MSLRLSVVLVALALSGSVEPLNQWAFLPAKPACYERVRILGPAPRKSQRIVMVPCKAAFVESL